MVVAGLGAVGARSARQLHSLTDRPRLLLVGAPERRVSEVATAIGDAAAAVDWDRALEAAPEVVVLCGSDQPAKAEAALAAGAHVVSTSGS
ncbi:MAG TPA: hypothetical protein VGR90_03475, partial [Acidimicrobiales bacterium]|nr:hypothetical protein [Acidimicrobiales bacterium]